MRLIEKYALECGLKIGKQFLLSKFFPVPADKYITLHAGSGQPAKNYTYWPEVVQLIHKFLEEKGISIVQIGKYDPPLLNCINLLNQTDIQQTNYVLTNSLLHVGGDSWPMHRVGEIKVPIVEIFGNTTFENHGPYRYNKKSIFIESHRFNKSPSFQAQEFPKTIDLIPPEEIANAILKVLDINHTFNFKSLFFGGFYQQPALELIPNCVLSPNFQLPSPPLIRMDYEFNEDILVQNLKIRKCIIITNKEINPNILSVLKGNIALLRIEIDNVSEKWLKIVKRIGINVSCYTFEKDEKKVRDKRLELLGACLFDQIEYPSKSNFKSNVETYINAKIPEDFNYSDISFKSNKFIVSNDKMYLSKAHLKSGIAMENNAANKGTIIDSEDFWMDQNHFYFTK